MKKKITGLTQNAHPNAGTIKNVSLKSFHPQKTNTRGHEKTRILKLQTIHRIIMNKAN